MITAVQLIYHAQQQHDAVNSRHCIARLPRRLPRTCLSESIEVGLKFPLLLGTHRLEAVPVDNLHAQVAQRFVVLGRCKGFTETLGETQESASGHRLCRLFGTENVG